MPIPDLGPLEYKMLKILWKIQPSTVREVMDNYNARASRKLKYTTVMTLLTRMTEKGVLNVDRERQPFQFAAAVSKDQILRQRLKDFVDLFFEGRPVELALRLVEESGLTEDSIRRLEERLKNQRSFRRGSGEEG